jgi:hypothetical protein
MDVNADVAENGGACSHALAHVNVGHQINT